MGGVGIIMECNPFHEGHQYIIESAAAYGRPVIVAMSGNFVQRGGPAILPKEERVRRVLLAGADMVLELPVRFATSGTEYFARGATALLARTGLVTDLVFGSESGDTGRLLANAAFLTDEPEDYRKLLKTELALGRTYPAARSAAATACSRHVQLSEGANDLLGEEYLCALMRMGLLSGNRTDGKGISPHAVQRIRSVSASDLRAAMLSRGEGMCADDFSEQLLGRLLMIDRGVHTPSFTDYAGIGEGLSRRIHRLLPQFVSWTQFCHLLKSRNQTYTAISRAMTHILLDITKDTLPTAGTGGAFSCLSGTGSGACSPMPASGISVSSLIPCVRVLGCRRDTLPLFGVIRDNGLPLITSHADAAALLSGNPEAGKLLSLDIHASETFDLKMRIKKEETLSSSDNHPADPAGSGDCGRSPGGRMAAVSEYAKPLIVL